MEAVEITPNLRADLEEIIEATGPLEDADPEFQDAVARVRSATQIPTLSLEISGLRLAKRALTQAILEVTDAHARLDSINMGLKARREEITTQIEALKG